MGWVYSPLVLGYAVFMIPGGELTDRLGPRGPDNSEPWDQLMTATGAKPADEQLSGDTYSVSYHGYGHTHGCPLPYVL